MNDLNLENLKIGDKVVSIKKTKTGWLYGPIRVVTGWHEKTKMWRYSRPDKLDKFAGAFPTHGGCYDFGSKNKNPDFYFSANPVHLKSAERQHKREQAAREKKRAKEKARFEEFSEKLHALLDEYGATVYAVQLSEGIYGADVAAQISIGHDAIVFKDQ
jgi:hypothetical protein